VGPGQFLLHCCVLYGCGVYQISFWMHIEFKCELSVTLATQAILDRRLEYMELYLHGPLRFIDMIVHNDDFTIIGIATITSCAQENWSILKENKVCRSTISITGLASRLTQPATCWAAA
jgi:hypothetical protein